MRKKIFPVLISTLLLFSGCGTESNREVLPTDTAKNNPPKNQAEENKITDELAVSTSDLFTDRDFDTEYNMDTAVEISLNGTSATCSSPDVITERSEEHTSELQSQR